ncbi:hypothetical protein BD413DRAFT_559760 [Trametes elegans]|nr:hypothetical protein BD413DRAFT_559760 [Trametes elegans]
MELEGTWAATRERPSGRAIGSRSASRGVPHSRGPPPPLAVGGVIVQGRAERSATTVLARRVAGSQPHPEPEPSNVTVHLHCNRRRLAMDRIVRSGLGVRAGQKRPWNDARTGFSPAIAACSKARGPPEPALHLHGRLTAGCGIRSVTLENSGYRFDVCSGELPVRPAARRSGTMRHATPA